MISILLAEAVLDQNGRISTLEDSLNHVTFYGKESEYLGTYNIYELAHKCKEWALTHNNDVDDNGYYIFNYSYQSDDYETKIINFTVYTTKLNKVSVNSSYHGLNIFSAESEPEAIFKACQWILDNKETK